MVTSRAQLAKVIAGGLASLGRLQQPDGNFLVYTPSEPKGHTTTFIASLIGISLAELKSYPHAATINRQIAKFLIKEHSSAWTFNYWPRTSPEFTARPYPDDMDDTFCALAAIYLQDNRLLSPTDFAQIIQLLVTQESAEGGPYQTWVMGRKAPTNWRDVDVAVNNNIGYFLHLQDISLPNITGLTDAAISDHKFTTPYYPSPYPVIYFISRAYEGESSGELIKYLLAKRNKAGHWSNPTATALAVSALINLGYPAASLDSAVKYLTESQTPDGWPADAFYTEGDGEIVSSPALTAALACEALAKYLTSIEPAPKPKQPSAKIVSIYEQAAAHVRARFEQLDPELRDSGTSALQHLLERDTDRQMAALSYVWAKAAGQTTTSNENYALLGAAGLYGWLAYTIYDDFLDGEGVPQLLPVANIALRSLTDIFSTYFKGNVELNKFTAGILDEIESANAWELAHCRFDPATSSVADIPTVNFGDLRRLAQRSLGHALGPLCVLLEAGHAPDSAAVQQTLAYFEHYLIARQLNDDVHDWEEDISRGQINAVGAILLEAVRSSLTSATTLPQLITAMRDALWNDQINGICDLIQRHVDMAQAALRENSALHHFDAIAAMLDPIEASVTAARRGSSDTKEFLSAFRVIE